jgi:hypothetical protein
MGSKGNKKSTCDPQTATITESIDFKDSIVTAKDPANQGMIGYLSSKTNQFPLVQTSRLAALIADRELKKTSYDFAEISFKANRNMFRALPGSLYNLAYPLYDIDSMIVRVTKIEEDGPESEIITVYATEDPRYAGQTCVRSIPETRPDPIILPIDTLSNVVVIEVPYVIVNEESIIMGVSASRVTGNEIGYGVYISNDGTTYTLLGSSSSWGVHGTLIDPYPITTYTIDDEVGFEVLFGNDDGSTLETTTRGGLFTNQNLGLLGNEFIAVQNITPVSTRRYRFTGVLRGKYETLKQHHAAGEDFYFLGERGLNLFSADPSVFYYQGIRYVKVVAFNGVSYSSLSDATAYTINFDKRAFTPYCPTNLKANDCGLDYRATYSTDVVLTWSTRIRVGQGCGYGNVDGVTDAAPTWEGKFEVKVYVGGVLKRTTAAIDDDTWTYTEAMNLADNTSLATEITFTVLNYVASGVERYDSETDSLIVRKA